MPHPRTRQSGFTLLEVVIASGILGLAVAALTQAVVAGQMQTYAALRKQRAVSLGQSMFEEVISKPYADPDGGNVNGPDQGEARADFDDVCDYDGFTQAPGSLTTAPGRSASGDPAPGQRYPEVYQSFSLRVSAKHASADEKPSLPGLGEARDGIVVKVTVIDRQGTPITLTRFVPRPAAGDAKGGGS